MHGEGRSEALVAGHEREHGVEQVGAGSGAMGSNGQHLALEQLPSSCAAYGRGLVPVAQLSTLLAGRASPGQLGVHGST